MPWSECRQLIAAACPNVPPPQYPYKLCDFRFGFGDIFSRYLSDCDFFGFGDIDVVYGQLRSFLTPEVLVHDLITFNATHVSGHLTLLRNTPEVTTQYRTAARWREAAAQPRYAGGDENNGYYGIGDVYAIESFNTPLSPYIPWIDGQFTFPYAWYYRDGRLTNSLNGNREFMYLHFMRYKQRWNAISMQPIVHFDVNEMPANWILLPNGFHADFGGALDQYRGKGIALRGVRSGQPVANVPVIGS